MLVGDRSLISDKISAADSDSSNNTNEMATRLFSVL